MALGGHAGRLCHPLLTFFELVWCLQQAKQLLHTTQYIIKLYNPEEKWYLKTKYCSYSDCTCEQNPKLQKKNAFLWEV